MVFKGFDLLYKTHSPAPSGRHLNRNPFACVQQSPVGVTSIYDKEITRWS